MSTRRRTTTARSRRIRGILEVTIGPAVARALDDHCDRTGEARSRVVEDAIVAHLGIDRGPPSPRPPASTKPAPLGLKVGDTVLVREAELTVDTQRVTKVRARSVVLDDGSVWRLDGRPWVAGRTVRDDAKERRIVRI